MKDSLDTSLLLKKEEMKKLLDDEEALELQVKFISRIVDLLQEEGFSREEAIRIASNV